MKQHKATSNAEGLVFLDFMDEQTAICAVGPGKKESLTGQFASEGSKAVSGPILNPFLVCTCEAGSARSFLDSSFRRSSWIKWMDPAHWDSYGSVSGLSLR